MKKINLTKTLKTYYHARTRPELITISPRCYVSIRGKGDPSGRAFQEALETLYPVIYKLKFKMKAGGKDFVVPKLEALWWYDETRFGRPTIADSPKVIPRHEWEYRLLIQLPDFIREHDLNETIKELKQKKRRVELSGIEFFRMEEGLCVQVLHRGAFDQEPVTLQVLQTFMQENHLRQNGYHHEIYLSDFRKTKPERLQTILREPVKT